MSKRLTLSVLKLQDAQGYVLIVIKYLIFMHWRRKWQPTPVFLPEESQRQSSLVGCRLGVSQSQTQLTKLSSSSSTYIAFDGGFSRLQNNARNLHPILLLVHLVNMVFPVVMYGCESWTIKKAEHRRIHPFETWHWRLLRVPWTARRANQSILKEISPK